MAGGTSREPPVVFCLLSSTFASRVGISWSGWVGETLCVTWGAFGMIQRWFGWLLALGFSGPRALVLQCWEGSGHVLGIRRLYG
jgi:hypothetical protein